MILRAKRIVLLGFLSGVFSSLLLYFVGAHEGRLKTPSPKHHRAHTPLTSTVSGSESEGEEDRREVHCIHRLVLYSVNNLCNYFMY